MWIVIFIPMTYPKHVAIIPDGNRTRAKQHWLSIFEGYMKSIDVAVDIITRIFENTQIDVLSWRGMSTENLERRPAQESAYLFWLFRICGERLDSLMSTYRINFVWIWNPAWIDTDFVEYLDQKSQTFNFADSPKTLVFAVNYGWRDEILRWFEAYNIAHEIWTETRALDEDILGSYMDMGSLPPVEFVIRTKWEQRISWFMSRWIWYAELFFTQTLYPDFTSIELQEALVYYDSVAHRKNFGA